MKRRDFFGKTGYGILGILASHMGFSKNIKKGVTPTENKNKCDFETLRKDFPPLKKFNAYMDTAFVGLMSKQVKEAHEAFLENRFLFGPFSTSKSILGIWMEKLEDVRVKLASFLGAKAKEIAFTYCTGCGSNIALNGINWQKGDNAVTDDLEYPTDLHILNALKKRGVKIKIAKSKNGAVDPETFEALVDKRTRAVVVSHISYLNGFRHDLKKLADIAHMYGAYLVVDSAQAVGGVKVNVKDEGVDFLSGIPYKWLNGPNGVGFMYIREELIPQFYPDRLGWASIKNFKSLETLESASLPKHAKRFEYGTLSFEGIYALDAAIDYINKIGIETIEHHNLKLINILREQLRKKNIKFYTPEKNKSPILSFFIDDEKSFSKKMKDKKIYITARRWKKAHARISPHFYNNEDDIEAFLDAFSS